MSGQQLDEVPFEDGMEHGLDDEPDYPKECFGCYAPGSEECDWCEFSHECAA